MTFFPKYKKEERRKKKIFLLKIFFFFFFHRMTMMTKRVHIQLIASVCLVLSVAAALTPAEPEFLRKSRYELLEKQFTKESLLHETGINWTWKSWLVGPTCPDNVVDGLEVADVDLTSDAMVKAFNNIDLLVDLILKQLKLQKYKLGISTGIIYNGKVIYNKGFGSVDMDKDVPPSGDTIFSIGSVTKIFTSRNYNYLLLFYYLFCIINFN